MKLIRRLISFIWINLHKHKLKKTVAEKIMGREFLVYPTVFNPKSYFSGKLFAEFAADMDLKGKSVLDMGCGSGIVAVFAALGGAEVTAADINPEAVKCTEANAKRNGVQVKVYESNLFGTTHRSSPTAFDYIFFNPPYYPKEPKNNFELAFNAGADYRVLREFASQSKSRLKQNGAVYMIISSDMGIEAVKNTFNGQGFQINIVLTKRKLFETFYVIKLVPAGL
jgi:release factor glutamine methyltransferase